jgi:signal transduction histidine kinase
MPNGGRLAIGLRTTRNEKAVEIIVSDSGHGIPKTQLKQVFKPFMTTKKGGFGLGLLLVKRICERHNGTIDLSSDVGRGTSVFLRFPGMIEP